MKRTNSLSFKAIWALSLISAGLSTSLAATASADSLTDSGTFVSIAQKNADLPANDLVYTAPGAQPRILSPHEARLLSTQSGVDLSLLDPDRTTDVWPGKDTSADSRLDQALPIQNGQEVDFESSLSFAQNFYAANILAGGSQLRLIMGKTMHTVLLRKEMLRRLGYKVPAMKYIPFMRVRFADKDIRHDVLVNQIRDGVAGSAQHWCYANQQVLDDEKTRKDAAASAPCILAPASYNLTSDREVVLQDVLVTEAVDPYYNLAIGPATTPDGSGNLVGGNTRILQSLAISYGLINVPESINQLNWNLGNINNQSIQFQLPDKALFNCSLDDALWITRRILKFTRNDFNTMLVNAAFPEPVRRVLLEKLISRRDSLIQLLGLQNSTQLAFDAKVSELPALNNGKIMQQDWSGYASRFAWGDPDSPLAHMQYYAYSILESNALDNLTKFVNSKLPQKNVADDQLAHHNTIVAQAIARYLQTGQPQKLHFGTWTLPIVNAGLIASRDIIAGPYLGTDNILQISDTWGYSARAGMYVGFDAIPTGRTLSGLISGSVDMTWTHVKPVLDMKTAFKEPIKKLYVPKIIQDADKIFVAAMAAHGAADAETAANKVSGKSPQDGDAIKNLQKIVSDDMNGLSDYLGLQESLIVTHSISGGVDAKGTIATGTGLAPAAVVSAEINPNHVIISRLHFYRKDATTIEVFKDSGEFTGLNANIELALGLGPAQFPIVSYAVSKIAGAGDTKIYTLNIDPNLTNNPGFFDAANALAQTLKSGSTEILDAQQKSARMAIQFNDLTTTKRFLFWINRHLSTNGAVRIQNTDGAVDNYLALSDGKQTGRNYQIVFSDAANFLFQRLTKTGQYDLGATTASNPGDSFLGHSQTRISEFNARNNSVLSEPYAKVTYRWEGWQKKPEEAMKLLQTINKKYGYQVFPDNALQDTRLLQLYQVNTGFQVYKTAINKMLARSVAEDAALVQTYCQKNPTTCGSLQSFHQTFAQYKAAANSKVYDQGRAIMNMVSSLEKGLPFTDLVEFFGGKQNVYFTSAIQAFRVGSEMISTPIVGQSFGHQDDVNPGGTLASAETILGIEDGEFYQRWMRTVL